MFASAPPLLLLLVLLLLLMLLLNGLVWFVSRILVAKTATTRSRQRVRKCPMQNSSTNRHKQRETYTSKCKELFVRFTDMTQADSFDSSANGTWPNGGAAAEHMKWQPKLHQPLQRLYVEHTNGWIWLWQTPLPAKPARCYACLLACLFVLIRVFVPAASKGTWAASVRLLNLLEKTAFTIN